MDFNDNSNIFEKLNYIGFLADSAYDNRDIEEIIKVSKIAEKIKPNENDELEICYYSFILSNIYSYLKKAERNFDIFKIDIYSINNELQLYHIRNCIRHLNIKKMSSLQPTLINRIHTNYGNAITSIGRPIEAIEYFINFLKDEPGFSMAEVNLADCLRTYGSSLYDDYYKPFYQAIFYKLCKSSLEGDLTDEARIDIENSLEYAKDFPIDEVISNLNKKIKLGNSCKEIDYRKWVLNNKLFLNPLNDLGNFSIAADDFLLLPDMYEQAVMPKKHNYYGFFNIIKQEFISARYIYYEGLNLNKNKLHFSDTKVSLIDSSYDYPLLNLNVEKIKYSYRTIFSIFDKISFFINSYLELGNSNGFVNYRNVWFEKHENNTKKTINDKINQSNNYYLRGLFWIYKDLYKNSFGNNYIPDPIIEKMNTVRNHLEHKYLKIHDIFWFDQENIFKDTLCFSINIMEFEDITLKLLKLIRETIIYLTLFVRIEESKLEKEIDKSNIFKSKSFTIDDESRIY